MKQEKPVFNIGVVGCGRISQAYTQALNQLASQSNNSSLNDEKSQERPTVKLKAVMDVRKEVAQITAEAEHCQYFDDLDHFIQHSEVQGAIICAPPVYHREISCKLLDAGIHVLCEKPFATQIKDARYMVETSKNTNKILMMASKFRYVEDLIRAKAMISSGMLGEVVFYENRFFGKVNMQDRWNSDPRVAGGGVLIDNGTHSVDIIRYLIGNIKKVSAQAMHIDQTLPVEDTAYLSVQTKSNCIGTVHLSWSHKSDHADYINISGTDGEIRIGWQNSKYQYNGHREWISFGVGYDKFEAFKRQIVNFVDTISGLGEPVITLDDAMASVEVIDAAYNSIKIQRWLNVEEQSSIRELSAAQ